MNLSPEKWPYPLNSEKCSNTGRTDRCLGDALLLFWKWGTLWNESDNAHFTADKFKHAFFDELWWVVWLGWMFSHLIQWFRKAVMDLFIHTDSESCFENSNHEVMRARVFSCTLYICMWQSNPLLGAGMEKCDEVSVNGFHSKSSQMGQVRPWWLLL